MIFMKSAGVVVYTIKNDTLFYLLLHNIKGHWDFPKGKIEKGEGKKESALRELKEEAGITASIDSNFEHVMSYFFTEPNSVSDHLDLYAGQIGAGKVHKIVSYFVGKAKTTKVRLSHEHDDFAWLPFDKAVEMTTFEEGKELLKEANQFLCGLDKNI